jgi:hypothetical protein
MHSFHYFLLIYRLVQNGSACLLIVPVPRRSSFHLKKAGGNFPFERDKMIFPAGICYENISTNKTQIQAYLLIFLHIKCLYFNIFCAIIVLDSQITFLAVDDEK